MLHHDSDKLQALISAFKSAEQQVHTALLETKAKDVEEYKLKLEKKIDSTNIRLIKKSMSWAKKDMPTAYKQGVKQIDGSLPVGVHIDSTDIQSTYIQLAQNVQHATDAQKEAIRNAIDRAENENSFGATVGVVKEIIQEELAKNNAAMVITYNNGAKMPLAAHAEMLARTSRIIASNTGSFDRCRQLGLDLVECTTVPNCCPYCKKYEGKVYSISGNDKRFPALYETALQSGYNIMHPNCRHEFIPYHESYAGSPEELQKVIEKSNHFEDLDKNDKLFKVYNKEQAFRRQMVDESREFHRLKDTLGDQMPYKNISSFRRARRAKSETYMRMHRDITELGSAKKDGQILDFYKRKGYNKEKAIERIEDLNRQYLEQVSKKKVKDIGFNAFAKTFVSASDRLVGQTTADGREIKGISIHFVERLFGDGTKGHKPVNLTKAIDTILTGKVRVSTDESVLYEKNGIRVSFNTVKNSIIQCNIDGDKK